MHGRNEVVFCGARCGCIGVPLPGVTLKLVPQADKLELRLKGSNITPGYYGNPEATALAFDEEGCFRTGDAVRPVAAKHPNHGLMFDGRLAENFKLTTGTGVTVGKLRTALVSVAGGLLSDAVIAGHDRDCVTALAWVDRAAARQCCRGENEVPLSHPQLRSRLADVLLTLNADVGSASRIERLLLLEEPASSDAGEITDKGYVNQRRMLERRAGEVQLLFVDPPGANVILASRVRS